MNFISNGRREVGQSRFYGLRHRLARVFRNRLFLIYVATRWICAGLALFGMVEETLAQTASQITPRSFAPPVQGELGGGISVGEPPVDTPAGADSLILKLSRVDIENGFPELSNDERELRTKLLGRTVSAAEIFVAARALEAAYAAAGYILVRVAVPPQQLKNGARLRLIVVDGFIEQVETSNLPDAIRSRITDILEPLKGLRKLKLKDLERSILLAGDVPGVILQSALAPGSTTGATILVINAKYQSVVTSLSADNTLAPELGRFQVGVGGDFNSVLGFGELGYVRVTSAPDFGSAGLFSANPRNRSLAAGFILPIGIDGLTFNLEGTQAHTSPLGPTSLQTTDLFQRLSLRLRYPWIRSRNFNFATQLAFDAQEEGESALLSDADLPLSQDRLRILRVVNEANYLASWGGTFTASLTGSLGLDVLGARTASDAAPSLPLSRLGANATFSKLESSIGYAQNLSDHLAANISAQGQTGLGSALSRSEQIGIAGVSALSAFNTGSLQGDDGVFIRSELSAPFDLPPVNEINALSDANLAISPYIFGAAGEIWDRQPTSLERPHIGAASYGVGLRIGGSKAGTLSNGLLAVEFARQARTDGLPIGSRFTLAASVKL